MAARAQIAAQTSHQLPGKRLEALGDNSGPHADRDARRLDVVAAPDQVAFVPRVAHSRSLVSRVADDQHPRVCEPKCSISKMRVRGAEERDGAVDHGWQERMDRAQEPIRLLGGEQADQHPGGAHGAFASCCRAWLILPQHIEYWLLLW